MKRLYILEIDANRGDGLKLEAYPVMKENPRGVLYRRDDTITQYYGLRNMNVTQVMANGTKARCVFLSVDSRAEDDIRLRKLALIDALNAEGQRRAINLNRMVDAV